MEVKENTKNQSNKYLTMDLLQSIKNNYADFNIDLLKSNIALPKVLNSESDESTIRPADFCTLLNLFEQMFASNSEVMQLFLEHNMKTHGIDILKEIINGNNEGIVEPLILYQQNRPPINISYYLNSKKLEVTPKKNEIFVKLYENNVIEKDHTAKLCYNNIKLLDHSITDSCSSNNYTVDTILSIVYSPFINKDSLKTQLTKSFENSPVLNDVMRVISTSTLDNPLFIQFVDTMRSHNSQMSHTAGYMIPFSNQIVIAGSSKTSFNYGTLMHELTHYSMFKICLNSETNPYTSPAEKELFNIAKVNILSNINNFLLKKFNESVDFSTTSDSFQIGKTLRNLVSEIDGKLDIMEYAKNFHLLACLYKTLKVYDYNANQEDKEFIAHYVDVISDNTCYNLLKQVVSPMELYWETVLNPKVIAYEEAHNINTCGAMSDYFYDQ
jgi:hypothetical protein